MSGDSDGLGLLLDRSWRQEVIHQLVLRELLSETPLAQTLGLWSDEAAPTVLYEPFRGLFDLALVDDAPRVLIELKVGADLSDSQRDRQRARALELGVPRVYVLLGPSFFMARDEPDARNIGTPELAQAIRDAATDQNAPIGALATAYLQRLQADAAHWAGEHNPAARSGLDLFRLYADMAAAWPVETRPSKATHPGGTDWIINGNAWSTVETPGWALSEFYWEMVNGRMRFKLYWRGDTSLRLVVRMAYQDALERAAQELNETVTRTRTRAGRSMTALELTGDARAQVLLDGRVSPELSRRLYDRTTAVFTRALQLLAPLPAE